MDQLSAAHLVGFFWHNCFIATKSHKLATPTWKSWWIARRSDFQRSYMMIHVANDLVMKNLPDYTFLHIQPLFLNTISCEVTRSSADISTNRPTLTAGAECDRICWGISTTFSVNSSGFSRLQWAVWHLRFWQIWSFFKIVITESVSCDSVEINKDSDSMQRVGK